MEVNIGPDCNPTWFKKRCRYAHQGVVLKSGCSDGGGRGLYVGESIRAGTTLLVEQHIQIGASTRTRSSGPRPTPAAYLRDMLFASCNEGAVALDLALTVLHPIDLESVQPATLELVESENRLECNQLEQDVSTAVAREGDAAARNLHQYIEAAAKEKDCMMRLLLTMRFNAFHSGVYFALAMLNHSCRPNCTKFGQDASRAQYPDCSELVAIRDIEAGEELCISYLQPVEQAHCVRSEILRHQHFFNACTPSPFPPGCEALHEDDGSSVLLLELRGIGEDLADMEHSPRKRMKRIAFEDNISSVRARMDKSIGPEHLYRTRLSRFIVRYCDVKMQRATDTLEQQRLILRQVIAAREVLQGMSRIWGKKTASTHHDAATMHDVCAQAIEYALASGDKSFEEDMYRAIGVATFTAASREESAHRRQFKVISQLYGSSAYPT